MIWYCKKHSYLDNRANTLTTLYPEKKCYKENCNITVADQLIIDQKINKQKEIINKKWNRTYMN